MKWIEPENGGRGNLINISSYDEIQRSVSSRGEYRIEFIKNGSIEGFFEYPDESSRDADFERIRRIALGICDHVGNKPSENADPYEVDWSKIPDGYDYVSADKDGRVLAFSLHPVIQGDLWTAFGFNKYMHDKKNNPDWRNSLRIRP